LTNRRDDGSYRARGSPFFVRCAGCFRARGSPFFLGMTASRGFKKVYGKRLGKIGLMNGGCFPKESTRSIVEFIQEGGGGFVEGARTVVLVVDQCFLFQHITVTRSNCLLRVAGESATAAVESFDFAVNGGDVARRVGFRSFQVLSVLAKGVAEALNSKIGQGEEVWTVSVELYLDGESVGLKHAAGVSRDRASRHKFAKIGAALYAGEFEELDRAARKLATLLPVLKEAAVDMDSRFERANLPNVTASHLQCEHEADEGIDERWLNGPRKAEVVIAISPDLDVSHVRGVDHVLLGKRDPNRGAASICTVCSVAPSVLRWLLRYGKGDFAQFKGLNQGKLVAALEHLSSEGEGRNLRTELAALSNAWGELRATARLADAGTGAGHGPGAARGAGHGPGAARGPGAGTGAGAGAGPRGAAAAFFSAFVTLQLDLLRGLQV
jgi:hypothetical protein